MKTIYVGEKSLDVSSLSNSQVYKLVEKLGLCNAQVKAVTEQENVYALKRMEPYEHVKCYKMSPKMWAGKKGYEMLAIRPTKTLSRAMNPEPHEPIAYYEEIGYYDAETLGLLQEKPRFDLEVYGYTVWLSTEKERDALKEILASEIV